MTVLYIKAELVAGEKVTDACAEACALSAKLGAGIEFNFNGCDLIAYPSTKSANLVEEYYQFVIKEPLA